MINVQIECTNGENDIPEGLQGIPGIQDNQKTEFRNGYILIDNIIGFYPSHDGKSTHIHAKDGNIFCVREDEEEVCGLIHAARRERNKGINESR